MGWRPRVYSAEKTLAGCFQYRNKPGLDVFPEALKLYLARKRPQIAANDLLIGALLGRVDKAIGELLSAMALQALVGSGPMAAGEGEADRRFRLAPFD